MSTIQQWLDERMSIQEYAQVIQEGVDRACEIVRDDPTEDNIHRAISIVAFHVHIMTEAMAAPLLQNIVGEDPTP